MGLVDYSDSDGSDSEQASAKGSSVAAKPVNSKPGFEKVVDASNPRKIKVALPNPADTSTWDPAGGDGGDGPPAKRARTAGAFGGFNSFLPAPKNVGKPSHSASDGGATKGRGLGLGRGVNLKTGSAPAFSREAPVEDSYEDGAEDEADKHNLSASNPEEEHSNFDSSNEKMEDIEVTSEDKIQPRKAMFRPLSVARKPEKKKKKPPSASVLDNAAKKTNGDFGPDSGVLSTSSAKAVVPKPKKSLFASEDETELDPVPKAAGSDEYQPMFEDEPRDQNESAEHIGNGNRVDQSARAATSNDLDILASTLNLTPAQRRQLFGRNGVPTAAQVAQFSVSEEYSHNQAMLAKGEANAAAAVKQVRSIAPGKHSLQQLMNQATSQKEALEESFSRGKANRKDAGSRYGW